MATTQNTYTGDNSTVSYSITFEYLEETDIKVSLDGVLTTAYSLSNATTVTFDTAPDTGVAIRIYRDTNNDALAATFFAGSAIRAQDLNDDFLQSNYSVQEIKARSVDAQAPVFQGNVDMGEYRITNMGDPTDAQDAATKAYIDARFGDTELPQTTRWKFTATGGETDLTGDDDSSVTLQYSVAHEQVYLNGVLQQRGVDYTAEDGSTITFTTALTEDDVVNVISVNNIVTVDAGANTDTLPQTVWSDTATAGQTTFSGTGNEGSDLAYQVAGETVILNGCTLTRNVDYTASTGTSIVLAAGAEAGDQLLVISANYIATSVASTLDAGNFNFTATGTDAQTRTVSDKLRDVVSVKDFGAVGDGTTDDTDAIQAALDSGAKRIHIPADDYLIESQLTVPTSVTVYGDGGGITDYSTKLIYSGTSDAIDISGSSGDPNRKIVLKDFKVECTSSATSAIKMTANRECVLENISVQDAGTATTGFEIEATENFGVYVNTFRNCEATGFTTGLSIDGDTTNSGTRRANSNHFYGCRFDSNTTGISLRGCDTIHFYGQHCESNTTGVVVEGHADGTAAIRIQFFGGYLENTTDIDSSDASPGGNGGVTMHGTRFTQVAASSILNSNINYGQLRVDDPTELTIASGVISISQAFHTVDTESDAATDDLDTINGANGNAILFLRAANSARTVVVRDMTGNINLAGGDFSLTATNDVLMLIYDDTINRWLEVGRNDNAA